MEPMIEDVFACLSEGLIYQTADGRIKLWNKVAEDVFGLSAEEALGQTSFSHLWNLVHEDGSPCPGHEHPSMITLRTGQALDNQVRGVQRPGDRVTWLSINTRPVFKEGQSAPAAVVITFADITTRKAAEEEKTLIAEVLQLINTAEDRASLLKAVLARLRRWSGCEAVGIRLREGEDYPYFETSGFPENFVRLENNLCTRDERGEIVRDAHSNPVLDCMCGNILQGRFDPAKSFFTGGGSFWSSHTTQLLATTTDADRQARTRNRCNAAGYESVALVPLRSGGETFGLIQLNDKRQGLFNAEKIALLERLADSVAGFLAKMQAEENLRQSEEKFRLIFETSPDAISINRLDDGLFLDVNQGYLALTGLSRAEVIGKTAQEIKVWEDPAGRDRLVERLRSHGKAFNQETRFFAKDGGLRTVLVSAVAITLDGEPCLLSIIRDIEDIKRSQSELRLWADAFTYCAHGMAIGLPADNIFLAANPAFARMLGRQVDDIVGWPISSIYDPADREFLRKNMDSVDRLGHVRYEARMLRADGASFPVQVDLVSVRDDAGRPLHRVASVQDISERKQAQEAIIANQKRLHAILQASADPVVVYDGDGLATFVNPAFSRVFGWRPEEVLGRRIPFVPPDQQAMASEFIAKLYATGGPVTLETKRLTKSGDLLSIVISAAGIPDDSGRIVGMVVNLTDVTQTTMMEAQLRQAQKMEAIGTLAGGIAHDFNNILGAIMGYTELAQELARVGQSNLEELAQLLKAAERARHLVQQILTFSRKGEANARPLSLNKSIRQALRMLERSLPKMIAMEDHLAPELQLVNADPNQMEQVLLNLATNAADAMPEGGRLIIETQNVVLDEEYCQQHLAVRPGRYVLLMVSDTGQGIEPGVMEHIFDPFFTTKAVGKGTGLGLATVYGIVKGHGGHVYCYSEPGLGATFKIYLPAFQAEPPGPSIETSLPAHVLGGSETILLVDDEPELRDLGVRTLARMGYRVLAAASGEEALEVFKAEGERIALVVMDLGMPGMGGHKCLKDMLALRPEAKVIIASGYSANGQVKASLEAGAAGYVAKPFRRADLLATVRSVLDGKPAPKA